jgi:DNA-binding LacI/PurR family transcriptional regulator
VKILLGAESVFKAARYLMIFCSTYVDLDQENRLLENLEQEGTAGYAIQPLVGGNRHRVLRRLIAKRVPVDIDRFGRNWRRMLRRRLISGERAVVQHLIDQGLTRIRFLARQPLELSPINERYQAYQHTL